MSEAQAKQAPDWLAEAIAMRAKGCSIKAIARNLGRGYDSVHKALWRAKSRGAAVCTGDDRTRQPVAPVTLPKLNLTLPPAHDEPRRYRIVTPVPRDTTSAGLERWRVVRRDMIRAGKLPGQRAKAEPRSVAAINKAITADRLDADGGLNDG